MASRQIRYSGTNRRGAGCVGTTSVASVAAWIEQKYNARWTDLDVFVGDVQVGGIGPHPDDGRRCWWGEP